MIQMEHTPIAVRTCVCVGLRSQTPRPLLTFERTAFVANVKIYVDTGALCVCVFHRCNCIALLH